MRKILLIGTGGTIACGHSEDGLKPLLTPEQLLSYVQDSKEFCETDTIQLMNLDSTNIEPKHWLAMASCIETHYDEYDGFVICHGTDTMAFTLLSDSAFTKADCYYRSTASNRLRGY